MPTLSQVGLHLPASPIRKLVPFAEQAKKRGITVHHLNIGQPDIRTPEGALEALRTADIPVIAYGHSAGEERYRRRLTEYYAGVGVEIDSDSIIVTTGGSEALQIAFGLCFEPGDEVLVPEPFYANYNSFAREAGVVIRTLPSTIEEGFALPSIEAFERAITPRTRAILICNPNNPTGYLYSAEELEQLRVLVLKHDLYLLSDEVYRDFCYEGEKPLSVLSLEGLEEHAVMIDSVSKRYSMCGVRVGAFVSRNAKLIDAALRWGQARLCPPMLGQLVAEAALDTPESYFTEVIATYERRRNCLVEALRAIPGVVCPTPQGAFYCVVKLPIDDSDRFAQWLLEEFSIENQTVMVAPATGFYATEGLGVDEIRIAYVLKEADLLAAARCLSEALRIYPGRTM